MVSRLLSEAVCQGLRSDGATEVIMASFATVNASNRLRKLFDPKKSTGTLVGAWLSQGWMLSGLFHTHSREAIMMGKAMHDSPSRLPRRASIVKVIVYEEAL